jgi:hypothetical protein
VKEETVTMPATVITKEPLDNDVDEPGIAREISLRIRAGAIRCWVDRSGNPRILHTEWNVIGENA